ncbi:Predicted thiol-disulfide oxidoreductase YuxK, DCC family [Andreprevotia lacus DSM 23236]|jgi:predicted DCC family thiol-disulfide oxidoreductase YuxK|uniref:Predicted thiol-disulfide oxidoreductase YuxK, DCC family n=1 Tax=Andreprevotia lacus DSM 23236 TaxID=1121001 RepID=A0A1W1XJL6_9NEIS|nr:DUF393 domain-containing protein [Andreprevotia lacus]SMC23688.1 Predicted thiol-disulfide oxidoreductase YuxK, DCC family [Andreprevotia lacus DSM 23236]
MLTVYFDGQCALCSTGMHYWHARAPQAIQLVDAASPDFDATTTGIPLADMMYEIHVRRDDGLWLRGVPALEAICLAAGMRWLAWPLRVRLLRPMWRRAYILLARYRYSISSVIAPACPNGRCSTPLWRE